MYSPSQADRGDIVRIRGTAQQVRQASREKKHTASATEPRRVSSQPAAPPQLFTRVSDRGGSAFNLKSVEATHVLPRRTTIGFGLNSSAPRSHPPLRDVSCAPPCRWAGRRKPSRMQAWRNAIAGRGTRSGPRSHGRPHSARTAARLLHGPAAHIQRLHSIEAPQTHGVHTTRPLRSTWGRLRGGELRFRPARCSARRPPRRPPRRHPLPRACAGRPPPACAPTTSPRARQAPVIPRLGLCSAHS